MLVSIKGLAAAKGIEYETSFHIISHGFDDEAEFHLSIHTSLGADAAMDFWDAIGTLVEHHAIEEGGFWVSVEWDEDRERERGPVNG